MNAFLILLALQTPATDSVQIAELESMDDVWAEFEASLNYQQGTMDLGDGMAQLEVPDQFRFLGPEDARRLLVDAWGNPPMDAPLGMLIPSDVSPFDDAGWGVIITFDEDGYVEDDEARDIDYGELLSTMQEDTRAGNEYRVEAGYEAIELVGWAEAPHYDAATNKLYWAKQLSFGMPENTLNYNVRVLGRRGVLVLNAVSGMSQLPVVQAGMSDVMDLVAFNEGHRYEDFEPGVDKIAAYGIGALVAGKVAAKAGFFKLLIAALIAGKKFVLIGLAAIGAVFARAFRRNTAETAEPAEAA